MLVSSNITGQRYRTHAANRQFDLPRPVQKRRRWTLCGLPAQLVKVPNRQPPNAFDSIATVSTSTSGVAPGARRSRHWLIGVRAGPDAHNTARSEPNLVARMWLRYPRHPAVTICVHRSGSGRDFAFYARQSYNVSGYRPACAEVTSVAIASNRGPSLYKLSTRHIDFLPRRCLRTIFTVLTCILQLPD
jgi:hypothetical protein